MPDEVSKKSLKVLDQKLKLLAEHAVFQVNINSVLGSGVKNPEDALTVARRAQELGFTSTVGILHDGKGQLKPLGEREHRNFRRDHGAGQARVFAHQRLSAQYRRGQENDWRCRSGSRYLYICEDGLVHWCSQQRGYPGIPLENTRAEERHANTSRRNIARRAARFPACSRSPRSTTGARRRLSTPAPPQIPGRLVCPAHRFHPGVDSAMISAQPNFFDSSIDIFTFLDHFSPHADA